MAYEWVSKKLSEVLKAERVPPLASSSGEEIFHLKSLMPDYPDIHGLGKTELKAKNDFENQIFEKRVNPKKN